MTGLIDREDVRKQVGEEIAGLSLLADPEEFKELLSRFIRYEDGAQTLRTKWRIVYNNSKVPTDLIGILAQDDDIRLNMLSNVNYLINYGEILNTSDLAKALGKIEGGSSAISENFEDLFEDSNRDVDNIVIPMLQDEVGRQKVRSHFETIKDKFLRGLNAKGFLNTIKALKGIEGFEDIYEEYGFWAELYDQIQTPKKRILPINKVLKLSQKEAEKIIGDNVSEGIKEQEFVRILSSDSREEKKLILQEVANGNPYQYKACGTTSFIIQAGDQIVKLGEAKRKYEVPYHPRIMMPYFRKKYEDDTTLEVFNYGNTGAAEITDEKLLEIYKELEDAGIRWGDARKANLLVLTKDNDLPDFIKSKEFNLFGFLEDSRFPTNNHQALKKGDIVICDLDMLYTMEDPSYQEGLLDDIIDSYLSSKRRLAKRNSKPDEEGFEH